MTKEQVIEFLSDPQVIAKLKKSKSEEEVVSYLKENGIDITVKKAQIIKEALATIDSYSGKLTDEQLDEITGGASVGKIMAGIVLGAVTIATIAGGGKFLYDVNNEINQQGTLTGQAKGFLGSLAHKTGIHERTPYQQAVHNAANWFTEAADE